MKKQKKKQTKKCRTGKPFSSKELEKVEPTDTNILPKFINETWRDLELHFFNHIADYNSWRE